MNKETRFLLESLNSILTSETPSLIEEALKYGADVNVKDKFGWTWLTKASSLGDEALCKLLLRYGANVDTVAANGDTPLSLAMDGRHSKVASLLLDSGADPNPKAFNHFSGSPLGMAAYLGDMALCQKLIDKGADLCTSNLPLCFAASCGNLKICQLFLKHGANINGTDGSGTSPLISALFRGDLDLCRFLLKAGASVFPKNKTALDPLLYTVAVVSDPSVALPLIQLLLAYGADPQHPGNQGKIPLELALETNRSDVVKLFQEVLSKREKEKLNEGIPSASEKKSGLRL